MHSAWTVFYNLSIATLLGAAAYIGEGEASVFAAYEAAHPVREAPAAAPVILADLPQVVPEAAASETVIMAGFTPEPGIQETEVREPVTSPLERVTALVTGETVNLRRGPSTSFDRIGAVALGQELVLTGKTEGSWVEVEHPADGAPVWIASRFIN